MTRRIERYRLIWGLVFLLLLIVARITWSLHGDWQDSYRDAKGQLCCSSNRDCRVVRARILSQTAEQVLVGITLPHKQDAEEGEIVVALPPRSVHVSEDMEDWACIVPPSAPLSEASLRCIFIHVGT